MSNRTRSILAVVFLSLPIILYSQRRRPAPRQLAPNQQATTGQVLTWNGSTWVPASPVSGPGMPPTWTVDPTTSAVVGQPASGQDAVPLTLAPNTPTPAADLFDVYLDQAKTTKALWLTAAGSLNFAGNSLLLGTSTNPNAAYLQVNGGTNTRPYLWLQTGDKSRSVYLSLSSTQVGVACASSSAPAPGTDCAAGTALTMFGADLGGTAAAPKVVGLQGRPVTNAAPTVNQVVAWNGSAWAPANPNPTGGVVAAGTIALSNTTTGTHNFTSALPAGSVCQIQLNADPASLPSLTYWPTYTTNAITVNMSSAGSGTFSFQCTASSN